MNNLDYSLLRERIILFGCVLFVCSLLLWLSFSQLSKQEKITQSTQSEMSYVGGEISHLKNLVSLFENFNTDYKKYEKKGFLREEKRLTWIETLEHTANNLSLNNLRYQISPQQKISSEKFNLPPSITLLESKLTLESGLIHEGDLVTLINSLNKLNSGLFIIDSCKIDRTADQSEIASSNNFKAACSTLWYTAVYNEQTESFIEDEI